MKNGPATCHPDKPALTKASGLCVTCYHKQRNERLRTAAPETELPPDLTRAFEVLSMVPALGIAPLPNGAPVSIEDAIRLTDEQLIAALPEAARVLREALPTRAGVKVAELLLRSYTLATKDGPRRFFSQASATEKPPSQTQVVIGLNVNPGAAGAVEVGKVVGTVAPRKGQ